MSTSSTPTSNNDDHQLDENELNGKGQSDSSDSIFMTANEACTGEYEETKYLVDALIPEGSLTLLSGPPKTAGKTTFVLHLAGSLSDGSSFLGEPVEEHDTLFLTEQEPSSFKSEYLYPCGLDSSGRLHFAPVTKTATKDWKELMQDVIDEARSVDPSLLVLDTFQAFSGLEGEEENSSGPVKKRLQHIKYVCSHCGMAAIIVHHDRKSGGSVVKAGRGSSAFQAVSDQILSLRQPSGDWKNNVRRLKAAGRYSGVPSERMIKLEDDGYVIVDDDSKQGKLDEAIVQLLPDEEPDALKISDVESGLEEHDFERSSSTIRRHLDNLIENDRVAKVGDGTKGDPHRYYAPLPPFPGANPDDSG